MSEQGRRVIRLSEFEAGQTGDCFVLLAGKERGTTRDGKPYYRAMFRDATRSVTAMIWSDTAWFADCDEKWRIGEFYKVRCKYAETSFGPQIDLDRVRPVEPNDAADGFEAASFYNSTRFDVDKLFAELIATAENEISDVPLRQLTLGIIQDYAAAIHEMPAAARNHHAFRGGYLEHVVSVMRTAVYLADKYRDYYPSMQPPLSKSLVVAGAILHDIGKLIELSPRPEGAKYTARGKLVGHIVLGRDLVRDKAAQIPELDPEILLRLEHIILSHQNLPEWGSPVAPHTPEALLVYYADDIDAKFHMMAAALTAPLPDDAEFTGKDNPLRRPVFRGLADTQR